MKYKIILLLILILYILICKTSKIKLNSVALVYDDGHLIHYLVDEFNKYAERKQLDVELSVTLYTHSNASLTIDNFSSSIEHLLRKKSDRYDLIFYDVMYSPKYAPYFIDLKEHLDKRHLDLYSSTIASYSCTSNDKWVGLPVFAKYDVLYCNMELLENYGEDIPETWDDLLRIGKKIKAEEKDNKDLIIYNGSFPDSEATYCSTQEIIYSFREEYDSPYPNLESEEAKNALKMIKKLKNELANDEIFRADSDIAVMKLAESNALFLKFWYIPLQNSTVYKIVPPPGKKRGISGSSLGGLNLGINKYIDEVHQQYALEALEFMTSKPVQRKIILEMDGISLIKSLYDEDDVCQQVDCNLIKNIQPISRQKLKYISYDSYSKKFVRYIHNYLYNNKPLFQTIQSIKDLTEVFNISVYTTETKVGFVVFVMIIVMTVIMGATVPFFFLSKYQIHFRFFSVDFWILIMVGLFLRLLVVLIDYGVLNSNKCHFRIFMSSLSFTFFFIPILHKLISNFPDNNRISLYAIRNKHLFIIYFVLFDIVLNGLLLISPIKTSIHFVSFGKDFRFCNQHKPLHIILLITSLLEKIIILFFISLLLFIEWNMIETFREIRLISTAISVDIVLYFLITFTSILSINDLITKFTITACLNILFVVSSYFILYGARIVQIIKRTYKTDLLITDDIYLFKSTNDLDYDNNSFDDYDNDSERRFSYMGFNDNERKYSFIERGAYNELDRKSSYMGGISEKKASYIGGLNNLDRKNSSHGHSLERSSSFLGRHNSVERRTSNIGSSSLKRLPSGIAMGNMKRVPSGLAGYSMDRKSSGLGYSMDRKESFVESLRKGSISSRIIAYHYTVFSDKSNEAAAEQDDNGQNTFESEASTSKKEEDGEEKS